MPKLWLTLLLNLLIHISWGQSPPFWEEIQAFKKQDSIIMPPDGAVLFVGSSSIRLWQDLDVMFPQEEVINRGFGGSALPDLLGYLPDIVLPYQPSKVVIYCGENDIATNVNAEETLERLQNVLDVIRESYPEIPIIYISIKPSPSRIQFLQEMRQANQLIENYIQEVPHMYFANVFDDMLDDHGRPLSHIFLPDDLHMNHYGYLIWKSVLEPFLGAD